jgi:peptidoglycan/LPS O-acetylase OafA/YrhL
MLPAAILLAGRSSWWLVICAALLARSGGLSCFPAHFAAGVLIAKHKMGITRVLSGHGPVMAATACAGFVLYGIRPLVEGRIGDELIWCLTGAGAAALLCVSLSSATVQCVLAARPAAYVGVTSYGIYLLHTGVLVCLTPRLLAVAAFPASSANWVVGLVATVSITVLLAGPFFWLVERPSVELGKRLSLPNVWSRRRLTELRAPQTGAALAFRDALG